jgi:hypothetical protein
VGSSNVPDTSAEESFQQAGTLEKPAGEGSPQAGGQQPARPRGLARRDGRGQKHGTRLARLPDKPLLGSRRVHPVLSVLDF